MPLFARSDVMSVTISKAHGGCGVVHRRPVVNGKAIQIWKLDCPRCQAHLANDPLWAGNPSDIPPTVDEQRASENRDVILGRSRDDIMALALAKLAGLPAGDMLNSAATQAAEQGVVTCSNGHDNFPTAKFCAECGGKLGTTAASAAMAVADAVLSTASAEADRSGKAVPTQFGVMLPPDDAAESSPAAPEAEPVSPTRVMSPPRQPRQPREVREARPARVMRPQQMPANAASQPASGSVDALVADIPTI